MSGDVNVQIRFDLSVATLHDNRTLHMGLRNKLESHIVQFCSIRVYNFNFRGGGRTTQNDTGLLSMIYAANGTKILREWYYSATCATRRIHRLVVWPHEENNFMCQGRQVLRTEDMTWGHH